MRCMRIRRWRRRCRTIRPTTPPIPTAAAAPLAGPDGTTGSNDPPSRKVVWRHVVYAAGYVVLGLALFCTIRSLAGPIALVVAIGLLLHACNG